MQGQIPAPTPTASRMQDRTYKQLRPGQGDRRGVRPSRSGNAIGYVADLLGRREDVTDRRCMEIRRGLGSVARGQRSQSCQDDSARRAHALRRARAGNEGGQWSQRRLRTAAGVDQPATRWSSGPSRLTSRRSTRTATSRSQESFHDDAVLWSWHAVSTTEPVLRSWFTVNACRRGRRAGGRGCPRSPSPHRGTARRSCGRCARRSRETGRTRC